MKKVLLSALIVLLSLSIVGCSKKGEKDRIIDNGIRIILYKVGTEEIIKEITVDNDEDINKLNEYLAEIEPLKEEEMVNLALAQEISIVYNDNVSVGIQRDEKGYCYYINKEKEISSLSKIPEEMYDFVIKIIS